MNPPDPARWNVYPDAASVAAAAVEQFQRAGVRTVIFTD